MLKFISNVAKSKRDRQFEILDERLIDIQGKLKNMRQANEAALKAIIEMLSPLGSVPSTLGLMETRLETIHGLVFDIKNSLPRPPGPPAKVDSVKFVFPGLKESE